MRNDLFYKHLTVKNIVFLAVIIAFVVLIFKNIEIFILFFASIVIACSLNPLVQKLEGKLGRNLASAIVLGGFLLLLVVCILPVCVMGIYQIGAFESTFLKYLNGLDELVKTNKFMHMLGLTQENIAIQLQHFSEHAGAIFNGLLVFAQSLGSALIYILISIICTYFFMADKEVIKETFLKLFPIKTRDRAKEIIHIIGQKIGGYIVAQVYAITSVGIVMTTGLFLFGVDYAVLLGLITAGLDIIPVVGPAIALVICLIATFETGLIPIIGVLVSFTAAQLIENNLVRPYFFGKLLNIHPILVFIFLFICAKYFGIVGALFAPAIAATASVLIEELYMKNID